MLDKIKSVFSGRNPPAPQLAPAQPDTVRVLDRVWSPEVAALYRFRKGMWVMVPDYGVGVLTHVYDDATVGVMLTNDDGTNKIAVTKAAAGIRQAKLAEIPLCRRPDASTAINLGYV